jgi:acetyl-CoA carboxylase beta subunit
MFADVEPADPLKFTDKKAYKDRLVAEQEKTGNADAVSAAKDSSKAGRS